MHRNVHHFIYVGDWSSGMIGVSKTFGGGSIPSSPARIKPVDSDKSEFTGLFCFGDMCKITF